MYQMVLWFNILYVVLRNSRLIFTSFLHPVKSYFFFFNKERNWFSAVLIKKNFNEMFSFLTSNPSLRA